MELRWDETVVWLADCLWPSASCLWFPVEVCGRPGPEGFSWGLPEIKAGGL